MSLRIPALILVAASLLGGPRAEAAGLSPNLNIRSPGPTNTMTMAAGRGYGSGYPAPPVYAGPQRPRITVFNSNDQFDTNGNLNPGGGGGGTKAGKHPNLD
jgi:hypothetical protein